MDMREKIARALASDADDYEASKAFYLKKSDAALAAMRGPTSAMRVAGLLAKPTKGPHEIGDEVLPVDVWEAMIDAASSDNQEGGDV